MCPQCGAEDVEIFEYDLGVDEATGWANRGLGYRCLTCGSSGDVECADEAAESD